MVIVAGAPCYELAKEREGAPLSLPRRSCPFFIIFPSFFVAALRGGLIRSAGGWAAVKALRKAKAAQKGDERILGDGDFVQNVLAQAKEVFERKYRLETRAIDLDDIAGKAAKITGIDPALIWSRKRQNKVVQARSLLCYWATQELGMSQASLSRKIGLTPSAISLAVVRGQELVKKHNYKFGN